MRIRAILSLALTLAVAGLVTAIPGAAAPQPAGGTKTDPVDFVNQAMPLLNKLGCNQTKCHGSKNGKGGFKLSMFGTNLADDYSALTRAAEGRRINKVEPAKSLFLLKATATIPHEGAQVVKIQAGSPEYNALASWVARGAPWGDEKQPELVSIEVLPKEQSFQKGETKQLSVTAIFSDGTKRDITRHAVYTSSDQSVATVDGSGKVQASGFGESPIIASYMRRFDTARVAVPQPLATPFPEVPASNKIDEIVFAKLKKLGIPPSEVCPDHVFIRRVYLDVMGTLPTPDEARAFLADKDPKKRSKLIDRLLADEGFANYWAMKWGDLLRIKAGVGVNRPAAAETYYRWVRESMVQNKPYDQFVRELVTASGSNYESGPANFFAPATDKDSLSYAEAAALIFMGVRIGCARCHVHPDENWILDDNLGLAAFFAAVSVKSTREWTQEIVYSDPKKTMRHPKTGQVVQPKFLGGGLVDLAAAENAANEAATAAANAKAAADKAAAAQVAAQKAAVAKRQQANEAKQKLDELVEKQQKPAEAKLAAATQAVTDATTAKAATDKALAEAKDAAAKSQQAYDAAEKTAKEAEAKAQGISKESSKSADDKKKAADEASAQRKAADAAKTTLAEAQKKQQQAQTQTDAAVKKLAEAEAQRKPAEQALAGVKTQVAAAMNAHQAADKVAQESEAATATTKSEGDKTQAALVVTEKDAAAKRSLAINQKQEDPRAKFADWLVSPQNPWFAKNIANRVWFWLLGRGIVHEADDVRSTNPPENPELLQYLEKELISNKYDLKHIFRLILNSATYQLSSVPNQWNEKDQSHFSHYHVRRLGAEQLLDALSGITDTWETFYNVVAAPNTTLPSGHKATQIPDGSTESPFLKLFGRATRDTSFESQRNSDPSMWQALYLVNSEQFQAKVVNSPRMRRLIDEKKNDAEAIEEIYLATLARAPTEKEKKRVLDYVWGASKAALDQAEAERKAADEALAKVKGELAKAATDNDAAEKAAQEAEAKANAINKDASKSGDDKKKAADEAAAKRKEANEAKTRREKLVADEKAAASKLAEANKKVEAANAARQQSRVPALQDALWALLNTKEFMCNH